MAKRFLRIGEVAETLGVCVDTVRKYTDEGKISCLRDLANQRRFDVREVAKFKDEFLKKD